ncbi:MAG: type II toxin-antitoxin system VapC family toxin [Candidatus Lokiarchaeota archaeon]|nr:type II toxin-antitoxin system VapC family toxin [Candidatus Lokiarchaeota archaeon]
MTEKAIIDAQVLFYFHYDYKKVPLILQELKKKVIDGEITVIIPTIAISELVWKLRKTGKIEAVKKAIERWEKSENVIIADFDIEIIKLMLKNIESHELHDEIIAMTCKKYNTSIIYSTDKKFEEIFKLKLRSWK